MNIPITFTGFAPGFCYTGDLNALFEAAFGISYIVIPTSYTQIIVSETTPAPADQDKVWVHVDGSNVALGLYLFSAGSWLRIQGSPYYAVDIGALNAVAISFPDDFNITTLASITGRFFEVKIGLTNTGPVTLTVNGLAATAVTYLLSPLTAGMLVAGQIVRFIYDGIGFQIQSPVVVPSPPAVLTKDTGEIDPLPAAGASLSDAHTLGVVPQMLQGFMVNTAAELGYVPDDVIDVNSVMGLTTAGANVEYWYPGYQMTADSLDVTITATSSAAIYIVNKTNGSFNLGNAFTPAKWKFRWLAVKF